MSDLNQLKFSKEKLDVRMKALELAVEVAKTKSNLKTVRDIITMAYDFYDFLENDAEFSIKTFHKCDR